MLLLKGRCKEADPCFHWGINCLWFTAEKQHAQEVADMPDRHVFWLFHNADAKDLLPFHSTKHPCATQSFAFWMGGVGGVVLGFCGGWWCVFSFWTLEDLCMSPKGFTAIRSCNLICLVCEFKPLKRKGYIFTFDGFCGTHCYRMSLMPEMLREIEFTYEYHIHAWLLQHVQKASIKIEVNIHSCFRV